MLPSLPTDALLLVSAQECVAGAGVILFWVLRADRVWSELELKERCCRPRWDLDASSTKRYSVVSCLTVFGSSQTPVRSNEKILPPFTLQTNAMTTTTITPSPLPPVLPWLDIPLSEEKRVATRFPYDAAVENESLFHEHVMQLFRCSTRCRVGPLVSVKMTGDTLSATVASHSRLAAWTRQDVIGIGVLHSTRVGLLQIEEVFVAKRHCRRRSTVVVDARGSGPPGGRASGQKEMPTEVRLTLVHAHALADEERMSRIAQAVGRLFRTACPDLSFVASVRLSTPLQMYWTDKMEAVDRSAGIVEGRSVPRIVCLFLNLLEASRILEGGGSDDRRPIVQTWEEAEEEDEWDDGDEDDETSTLRRYTVIMTARAVLLSMFESMVRSSAEQRVRAIRPSDTVRSETVTPLDRWKGTLPTLQSLKATMVR